MSHKWIYQFDEPAPFDADPNRLRAVLGGKGLSLRQMSTAGFHVPSGFTITTECCAEYYKRGRRWPDGLEEQVRAAMAHLEKVSGRRFGATRRPLLVSVRSGAAESMPGMMDTLLNCGLHPELADEVGDTPAFWTLMIQFIEMYTKTVHDLSLESATITTPPSRARAMKMLDEYAARTGAPFPSHPWDALVACINAVFESWDNERAITYRRRHDIRNLLGTAVNVQMMFPSEVSGIVFSKDPTAPNANRMVIEASFGLGEAVVSGDVTPDRFLVDRHSLAVIEKVLGQKQAVVSALGDAPLRDPKLFCLDDDQIRELAALSMKIEAHFHHPADIEFGFAEGRFALLQSRRIRGLETAEDVEKAREEEVVRLRRLTHDGEHKFWVTHNLGETLRYPTPLTWDIVRPFMSGSGGFGRLYRMLGYHPSSRVDQEGFLELIAGRIYADPDRLSELFWSGMPLRYDMDKVAADRQTLDQAPTQLVPEKADNDFLVKLPRVLWSMMQSASRTRRLRSQARQRFEQVILPPFLDYVRTNRHKNLTGLSDQAVIAELNERRRKVLDEFAPESLLPGFFGSGAFAQLESLLMQVMGHDQGRTLAMTLTRALDGDTTFEQDAMLHKVAEGQETLAAFLERFGHRAVSEMELGEPRWREDPMYIERMIANIRKGKGKTKTPHLIHDENLRARRDAEKSLPDQLQQWGASSLIEIVQQHLHDAQALLAYRESGKHYLMMGYELIRLAIEELASRWDTGRGVYYLKLDELERYPRDRAQLDEAIRRRQIRRQAFQRLDVPDIIDSRQLDDFGLPRKVSLSTELTCVPVAAGIAEGPAAVVFNPNEALDLESGYVLVCPSTDPGWTPLFVNAVALVVERGGVLSHGAIVARDFGIPAVVCENATARIEAGRQIKVDGNTGRITFI